MIRVMRQTDDDLDELEKSGVITTADKIKMVASRSQRRDWGAEKAAPYMHPRLASVEVDTNPAEHESWLDDLDD